MSDQTQFREQQQHYLERTSFIEMSAYERAASILDDGKKTILLGPFERIHSPWLAKQGIVIQEDDGVTLLKGTIDKKPAIVMAIESAFQGGSIGEVSGSKIAAVLEKINADFDDKGIITYPVILFETGGVRLQEANLGLEVISEIQAGIVALRGKIPVIGVIAGMVGCFGGMSLAASMCSYLIMTRQARLGMNGPEVIEQEAGIEELNASDRTLIWSLIGGEQRVSLNQADVLVEDDAEVIAKVVRDLFSKGVTGNPRTARVSDYLKKLARFDTNEQCDPRSLRLAWQKEKTDE